ncbi:MAG: glycosyltransferase family 61 protein, partial [Bacteroidales bacterium]|nr:glycosyltransferase family 61 protein [Bacteroidales bacterium]
SLCCNSKVSSKKYLIYKEIYDYSNIDLDGLDDFFKKNFSFIHNWKNDTYIFCYPHKCYIEPIYGWVISQNKKILMHSVPNSYREIEFGGCWGKTPKPNSFFYYKSKHKSKFYKEIISLNYQGGGFGTNYFFFYDQLIGQLLLLESKNINIDLPVLVDFNIYNTSFFQEALKLSEKLKNINWIVRNKSDFIISEKVYCARTICYKSKFLIPTVSLFSSIKALNFERKIFLTRSIFRSRHIRNKAEIENIAKSFGYEIIDNDKLSLVEQISLFKSCSKLIALHGAGNINIIFRFPNSLKFLELQTPDWLAASYFIIAKEFSFDYQAVIGSNLDQNSSFYINPYSFKEKIISWLEN